MCIKFSLFKSLLLGLTVLAASVCPQDILAWIPGKPVAEIGWFTACQGKKSQHIDHDGLIGDNFKGKKSDQNFMIGLGYYICGMNRYPLNLLYGINAFYLAPTKVSGKVTQKDHSSNLSFHYSLTNVPVYFTTKALLYCDCLYEIVLDLGIGPNFINTWGFKEKSRNKGITVPDRDLFSGKTSVDFSAMIGLDWRIYVVRGCSFNIGYRFFYLGEGRFNKNSNQLKNTLKTGNNYANAFYISTPI